MTRELAHLRTSARDVRLAGACGGPGEHTPLPAWLWRAVFVVTVLWVGVGLLAYLALWLFMPRERSVPPARHEESHATVDG